jgi:hypothetical protein
MCSRQLSSSSALCRLFLALVFWKNANQDDVDILEVAAVEAEAVEETKWYSLELPLIRAAILRLCFECNCAVCYLCFSGGLHVCCSRGLGREI